MGRRHIRTISGRELSQRYWLEFAAAGGKVIQSERCLRRSVG
jgi:hypothetical protein